MKDPRPLARFSRIAFLAPALLVAACHQSAAGLPAQPAAIVQDVALTQATSCDALAQSVIDTAVLQMRVQLDAEKSEVGCCLFNGPIAATGAAAPASSGAGAPASYSTTNTQVAGVDEADFMKNDGTRIFTLSGQTLHAASSWPASALALEGQLDIEGWPSDMFLDGNQVVVFSSIWTVPSGGGLGPSGPIASDVPISTGIACGLGGDGCFYGWSTTKITVVDVTNLAAPTVTAQLYLPGYETGARRVGSSVRLVLSDSVRWPEAVQWWPTYSAAIYQDQTAWAAAIDALEDANEAAIRAAPLQSWFPDGQRVLPDGSTIDLSYQCTDFYVSNAPEQLGLVTVATLDLDDLDAGVSRAGIVGESDILYATSDHLYLASPHWWWWSAPGQQDWTYIHEFDISDPVNTVYIASGGVEGHIGDQFSLDESNGYLRVATSTAVSSQDPSAVDGYLVGSRLSILAPEKTNLPSGVSTALMLVGEIPSLEDNEQITAMSFVGDTGYAVTFRAVDPLVTLDLSDPVNPKKVAELTIPGFSTYLQPIDANHLLAIGEDFPVGPGGVPDYSQLSIQLSLFDVTDLSNPQRTSVAQIGTASSSSEALWDHHAFNWYQPDPTQPGILAIPFSDWTDSTDGDPWDGFVSDIRLFQADPASGITPLGALGMSDVYIQSGNDDWSWYYRPWVRRSVLSTDQNGNTFVYAISDAGLRSAALSALTSPLATALFPDANTSPSMRAGR